MHLHLGVIHGITIFASVIIVGFFWRIASHCLALSDNSMLQSLGQGMAWLY